MSDVSENKQKGNTFNLYEYGWVPFFLQLDPHNYYSRKCSKFKG